MKHCFFVSCTTISGWKIYSIRWRQGRDGVYMASSSIQANYAVVCARVAEWSRIILPQVTSYSLALQGLHHQSGHPQLCFHHSMAYSSQLVPIRESTWHIEMQTVLNMLMVWMQKLSHLLLGAERGWLDTHIWWFHYTRASRTIRIFVQKVNIFH